MSKSHARAAGREETGSVLLKRERARASTLETEPNVATRSYARQYLARLQAELDRLDLRVLERVVGVLAAARGRGDRVFICGNGGSAALASHLACDLNKTASAESRGFMAIALTDNVPLLSAWANDSAYADVFSEQLRHLVKAGDVLIVISASGNSSNVIAAARLARARGATTIGLLGFGGGRLSELVDHALCLEEREYGIVEDAHSAVCHLISNLLRRTV